MSDEKLLVGGFVSLTSVDYPGSLAFVVFLQGCPWRCRYCHNRHLQTLSPAEALPWEDVLNLIKARTGFIDAVVFSGGEPLMQNALPESMQQVKALGLKVGLHTGGAFPERLARIADLVDWVGFDIKHTFEKYALITNISDSGEKAFESLKILIDHKVNFEARMTVDLIIPTEDVLKVMHKVSEMGVKNAVLQKCRDKNGDLEEHPIFSDKKALNELSRIFETFLVRS